jgi:hypothetical protein
MHVAQPEQVKQLPVDKYLPGGQVRQLVEEPAEQVVQVLSQFSQILLDVSPHVPEGQVAKHAFE